MIIIDGIAGEIMILTTLYGVFHCYACFKKLGIDYTSVSNFRTVRMILADSMDKDGAVLLSSSRTTSLHEKKDPPS